MADGGSGEKTEEPTPERLRKLRKDGNVAKSQDITSAISFLVVFVTLSVAFPMISDKLIEFTLKSIAVAATLYGDHKEMPVYALLTQGLIVMGTVCGPVLA